MKIIYRIQKRSGLLPLWGGWTWLLLLLFSGCGKDDNHQTDHPDHARVTITIDWGDMGAGIDKPATYIVATDTIKKEAKSDESFTSLFEPGDRTFYLYNTVAEIPVTDGVAKVTPTDGLRAEGSPRIESLPGWLFTGTLTNQLEKDSEYTLTATMQQQVRQLTVLLTPEGDTAGEITAIEGDLTGVAGELNIGSGVHSAPSKVPLRFTPATGDTDAGTWSATVRLLGIAGEQQILTARVSLAGLDTAIPIEIDLTEEVSGFNEDKKIPLTVNSRFIIETPPGPVEPVQTQVTLVTDWSDRGAGVEIPSAYIISTTGVEETTTGETYTMDTLFDPGTYPFYLYNKIAEIAVSDGIATVNKANGAYIHANPGWFFTGFTEVDLPEEETYEINATMHQQLRQLTLILKPQGENRNNIERITANLSGIASSLDLRSGEVTGEPSAVSLAFEKQQDGNWAATVRILGTIDKRQKLSGTIYLTGDRDPVPLNSDLAKELQDFNRDKITPIELTTGIEIGSDPEPEPKPEPEQTTLTLVTDWSDRGTDVERPSAYIISTTGVEETATGESYTMKRRFDAGTYPFYLYNKVPEIAVTGGIAKVNAANGSYIHANPGWFFTGFTEVTLQEEAHYNLRATMHQQVRQFTILLAPEGNAAGTITSIQGTLTGIAGEYKIGTHTHSLPSNVSVSFTKITEGTDAGKWWATLRVLGIAGPEQLLDCTIRLDDSREIILQSNLSNDLSTFNRDKKTPFTLQGNVIVEVDIEAGFSGTIKDWEKVNGGSGIAN